MDRKRVNTILEWVERSEGAEYFLLTLDKEQRVVLFHKHIAAGFLAVISLDGSTEFKAPIEKLEPISEMEVLAYSSEEGLP